MKRREFITLLGGAAAAWPLAARAQQGGPIRRVGVLIGGTSDDPDTTSLLAVFQWALQERGWIEGRTIQFEYRFAGDDTDLRRNLRSGACGNSAGCDRRHIAARRASAQTGHDHHTHRIFRRC